MRLKSRKAVKCQGVELVRLEETVRRRAAKLVDAERKLTAARARAAGREETE